MVHQTKGIVLRSVKYGETSLIVNVFTERYGVNAYLVQGVRSAKARGNRAGLLQPSTLLDMAVYHKPHTNLQRIREYQAAYLYTNLHEEVVKNSIALFSVEVLLKLLPEDAPQPEIFEFCFEYFKSLDQLSTRETANFPIYFISRLGDLLGFNIRGTYAATTPHLNLHEGAFTEHPPLVAPFVSDEEAKALSDILSISAFHDLSKVSLNAATRYRLLDWFLAFLHLHTQHLGSIRSLAVLKVILH